MKSSLFLLAAMALLLPACYPEGPDEVADYYVVATQNDPSFNFSKVKTYVLVDSVVQLGGRPDQQSMVLTPKRNAFILQQVAGQFNNLGYTAITSPADGQKPDVLVQVSAVVTESTAAYYNDSWWDYWDWYPGWAYYYPYVGGGWYPYGAIALYRYRTGTLNIEVFDPAGADASTRQIRRVWIAALENILTGNPSTLEARLGSDIGKAFRQSPYLKPVSQ
ncbi:MAG: DUF4136 domain-containing protein [Cytophagales bacterium]|nr:DUF4136 domain-containing protein [Cytophagales bacterium]